MTEMARVLGVSALLDGAERRHAAQACADCADRDTCRDWLSITALRGADRAPAFCRNAATFERLASEAPATL